VRNTVFPVIYFKLNLNAKMIQRQIKYSNLKINCKRGKFSSQMH
jgi:hypothetical protein